MENNSSVKFILLNAIDFGDVILPVSSILRIINDSDGVFVCIGERKGDYVGYFVTNTIAELTEKLGAV